MVVERERGPVTVLIDRRKLDVFGAGREASPHRKPAVGELLLEPRDGVCVLKESSGTEYELNKTQSRNGPRTAKK